MAAPDASVNLVESESSLPQDKTMADQDMPTEAVGAASSEVRKEEEMKRGEGDLVSELLDKADQEVEASTVPEASQQGVEGGEVREASPAISEGSLEGDVTGEQEVGAAAAAILPSRNGEAGPGSPAPPKKGKKKEDKGIEHILKALNSLSTPEEKLAALCKKYADLHEDHRVLKTKFKQGQHKLTAVLREKDQLQTEHSKAVLAKSKLESLCRELQRHNKLIKDESLARAREEEEKRKEVTNRFQTTINEIQTQMNDHYTKNTKLREENVVLANKLKSLIDEYEQREQHLEKVLKRKDLEQQLVDAKLQQANLKLSEEKERSSQEKKILLTDAAESSKKVQLLEEQDKALRAQVGLYTEKYEEFQQTLSKSNEVFGSFKVEMDKMTKKIKKLEKETIMWKQRWENSNRALAQMADEKTTADKEMTRLTTRIKKLESLCRALQQERNKSTPERDAAAEAVEAAGSSEPLEGSPAGTPDPPPPTPSTGAEAANSTHEVAAPDSTATPTPITTDTADSHQDAAPATTTKHQDKSGQDKEEGGEKKEESGEEKGEGGEEKGESGKEKDESGEQKGKENSGGQDKVVTIDCID